jgi:3-methyladenine DNA glycosylase Mpg
MLSVRSDSTSRPSTRFPGAVLLRAAMPAEGIDVARERRPVRADRDLMREPGNLPRALGVTGE